MIKESTKQFDLMDKAFIDNPYPFYESFRQSSPIVSTIQGGYLLTRHADISNALKSPYLTNSPSKFSVIHPKNKLKYVAAELCNNILPFQEGMEHLQNRAVIQAIFRTLGDDANQMLRATARNLILNTHSSAVDIVSEIGERYALDSMCKLIGLPEMDTKQLKLWTENFFYLFAPQTNKDQFEHTNQKLTEFRSYLFEFTKSSAFKNRHTIFKQYYEVAKEKGYDISAIIDNIILLFADGVENIQYGLATILIQLHRQVPSTLNSTDRQNSSLQIVQECLRLDTPAQIIPRIVKKDFSIGDVVLKQDRPVFLALGSGNRDESIFNSPDQFKLDRDYSKVFTFGSGKHACIGKNLALNMLSIFIEELAQHSYQIITGIDNVQYIPRFGHRWPEKLNIYFY